MTALSVACAAWTGHLGGGWAGVPRAPDLVRALRLDARRMGVDEEEWTVVILRILGTWLLGALVVAAMAAGGFTLMLAADTALVVYGGAARAILAVAEAAIGVLLGGCALLGCTVGVWWLGREALRGPPARG